MRQRDGAHGPEGNLMGACSRAHQASELAVHSEGSSRQLAGRVCATLGELTGRQSSFSTASRTDAEAKPRRSPSARAGSSKKDSFNQFLLSLLRGLTRRAHKHRPESRFDAVSATSPRRAWGTMIPTRVDRSPLSIEERAIASDGLGPENADVRLRRTRTRSSGNNANALCVDSAALFVGANSSPAVPWAAMTL
jgi:hypothetical protein